MTSGNVDIDKLSEIKPDEGVALLLQLSVSYVIVLKNHRMDKMTRNLPFLF